jgi:hypothetical protein
MSKRSETDAEGLHGTPTDASGENAQTDLELKHNRAIVFLRKHGRAVSESEDGQHIRVDDKQMKVLDLHKLANELYGPEWRAEERKFREALRKKRT